MVGRQTKITPQLIEEVHYLKEIKELPISEIGKTIGLSRPTIYKILKTHLDYQPNKLIKIKQGEKTCHQD